MYVLAYNDICTGHCAMPPQFYIPDLFDLRPRTGGLPCSKTGSQPNWNPDARSGAVAPGSRARLCVRAAREKVDLVAAGPPQTRDGTQHQPLVLSAFGARRGLDYRRFMCPPADRPQHHVMRDACKCGPPPELCVPSDAILTQFAWKAGVFRDAPRQDRGERGLSVLIGAVSIQDAAKYVLMGEAPTTRQLSRAVVRLTSAGRFRAAKFAVIHTPGRIKEGIHATVVWPDADPVLLQPEGNWDTELSILFNSCFNDEGR